MQIENIVRKTTRRNFMKKLLIVFLTLFYFLPLSAKSYSEFLSDAKKYESQKKWCFALGAYYDAMGTDEAPENKKDAVEGYTLLSDAILNGNPGLGKFNKFTIHDEWKNLLIDAEQFGSSFNLYEITIHDLIQGDLDYKTKTATYTAKITYRKGNRYKKTISVISEGYKKAYKSDWTDLPAVSTSIFDGITYSNWPDESVSSNKDDKYNVHGALVFHLGNNYLNAFEYYYENGGLSLHDFKFNIVDENGKELVKGKRWLLAESKTISFSGITPDVMDLIDNGKAFVNPVSCYLEYGKYNSKEDQGGRTFIKSFPEVELPIDSSIFLSKETPKDKVYSNFSWAMEYEKRIKAIQILNSNMIKIPEINIEMFKTEVSQELYESIMGINPSALKDEKGSVDNISWYDAIYFCNKLSEINNREPVYSVDGETYIEKWNYTPHKGNQIYGKLTQNISANGYRLPTREEWKYAANGDFGLFNMNDDVGEWGWDSGYVSNDVYYGLERIDLIHPCHQEEKISLRIVCSIKN